MRNIHNCLMWFPEIQTPLECSYPNKEKCGLMYAYIRPEQERMKPWFQLCAYRIREIGLSDCIKEKESLRDLKRRKKK